jgi:hypothetical protein
MPVRPTAEGSKEPMKKRVLIDGVPRFRGRAYSLENAGPELERDIERELESHRRCLVEFLAPLPGMITAQILSPDEPEKELGGTNA